MTRIFIHVSVIAGLLFASTVHVAAGQAEFTLAEHLGVEWRDELVTFSFEFPEGECHPESLRLRGASGLIPVQVFRSTKWADNGEFLKSATIGFFANLKPLEVSRYILAWEVDPPGVHPAPPSELKIIRRGDRIAAASPAFGAVFQVGREEFAEPVDSANVPGPVREMLLSDGRRFGGSEFYGPTKITAWSGEMLDAGPVFVDMRWRYRYADGSELVLRARLGARDTAIYWDMSCRGTLPNDGWRLLVSNGLPPLTLAVRIEHFSRRRIEGRTLKAGDLALFPIASEPEGRLTSVTPWADWTDDYTQTAVTLNDPAGVPVFFAASRDAGIWVQPETDPGKKTSGRIEKSLPFMKRADGLVSLDAPMMDRPGGGIRRWTAGVLPDDVRASVMEAERSGSKGVEQKQLQLLVDKRRLDRVKDFVLEWPQNPAVRRPMLIVNQSDIDRARSRREIPRELAKSIDTVRREAVSPLPDGRDGIALAAWMFSGSSRVASDMKLAERLRQRLGLLGTFDVMRSMPLVAILYDGIIDSGLFSPAERRLLRAQMAYLGYHMDDPATWSIERGFNTSIPNMNVSMVLGKGLVACALPDHPLAPQWITPALEQMDRWLDEQAGSHGEWPEGSHYDHVTASTMVSFAITAKNAGFKDYSRHANFRLLLEYIAKQYTPPDPRRDGVRVTPPLGRANAGWRLGIFGVVARLTRDAAPAYSAEMQWAWRQSGQSYLTFDNRLSGLEYLYIDPDLPVRQPNWGSEWFPKTTAVLRNRFGQRREDYVSLLLNPANGFARAGEVGAVLQWFAFGAPVAGAFSDGYTDRHELMTCRVAAAASPTAEAWQQIHDHRIEGGVSEFFTEPQADYLDARFTIGAPENRGYSQPTAMPAWPPVTSTGSPPISWRRQVVFVKGSGNNEAAYLVFRDTIATDQPTFWQFWSSSNGIHDSASARGAPSNAKAASPSRSLTGRQFTAIGQYGVDLDFFVLDPIDPNGFTLRWETAMVRAPDVGLKQVQDLVQLRLPGAGGYTVVVIPRIQGTLPSLVAAELDGRIIRIRHPYGEDVVVFGEKEGVTTATGDTYSAPISCTQTRAGGSTLTMGPSGAATIGGKLFDATKPLTKRLEAP